MKLSRTLTLLCAAGTTLGVLVAFAPPGGDAPTTPSKPAAKSASKSQPKTADMTSVKRQAFDVTTVANGDLQAKNQLELRSKLESQSTIQFVVAEGTRVKKGDLLVQLNGEQIQNEIDQTTPQLASGKASLVAAENSYQIQMNDNASALRKAELQLQLAELAMRQWSEGDVVKRRQELETRAQTASLELERTAEKFRRSEDLLEEGFLSKNDADQDELAYIRAISDFTTSKLDREVFETYEYAKDQKQKLSDVEEAKAEVERVRLNNEIQLASKEADKHNQREQVTLLENKLKKLRDQLEATKIVAPQDGLVVYASSIESSRWGGWSNEGPMQIGSQVYPNQLIMALPDTSEMVAAVRVHEALAGRIKPGQPVQVKIEAAGGQVFQGKVDSIGVMAESGGWRDPNLREYTVKVALETKDSSAELKPAMRVEARVILENVEEVLTVPVQALYSEGAVQFVYSPKGSRFERVPVRVGRKSDTVAEVAAGLTEGATVLLRQPAAGEVLGGTFDDERLTLAGYTKSEDGTILPPPGGRGGKGGGKGAKPVTVKREGTPEANAETKEEVKTEDAPAETPAATTASIKPST